MFTLNASAVATSVGSSPEGDRVDVQYDVDSGTPPQATTNVVAWKRDWGVDNDGLPGQNEAASLADAWPGALPTLRSKLGAQVAALQGTHRKNAELDPERAESLKKVADAIVAPNGGSHESLWLGFEAKIVSGSDWVLFRNDGVAELNTRLAFQSTDDPDQALVMMAATGSVDLMSGLRRATGGPAPQEIKQVLTTGLPVVLAATFEAGNTAPSWAPERMKRQAAGFWKYERLTRGEFLVVGTFKQVRDSVAGDSFELAVDAHIYELGNHRKAK